MARRFHEGNIDGNDEADTGSNTILSTAAAWGGHIARSAGDQYDPHPVDGRGTESQRRTPGDADGAGAGGVHAVAKIPPPQPEEPALAEPRPVHPVEWP